jgi:hypothetical protein
MPIIYDPNPSYHYPFYCYIHMLPDWTPFYIGKGSYRRATCVSPSSRNSHYSEVVKEIGVENVLIFLFPTQTEEDAYLLEVMGISCYTTAFELCNKSAGGYGGSRGSKRKPISEETRRRMSIAQKGNKNSVGNQNWLGKKHQPETLAKMVHTQLGHENYFTGEHTVEARIKMSEANKGVAKSEDHKRKLAEANIGKRASEVTKEKMSKSRKGVPKSEETRKKMSEARKRRVSNNKGETR